MHRIISTQQNTFYITFTQAHCFRNKREKKLIPDRKLVELFLYHPFLNKVTRFSISFRMSSEFNDAVSNAEVILRVAALRFEGAPCGKICRMKWTPVFKIFIFSLYPWQTLLTQGRHVVLLLAVDIDKQQGVLLHIGS